MAVQRRAHVEWGGNLPGGRGTFTGGGHPGLSRVERPDGRTSPEELLAAAHASCYATALAHTLAVAGKGALKEGGIVEAVATLDEERLRISAVDLDVRGSVAGLSEEECERLAQDAEKACPVSNAIRANVEVRPHANLLGE